jgi:hypothetical protein
MESSCAYSFAAVATTPTPELFSKKPCRAAQDMRHCVRNRWALVAPTPSGRLGVRRIHPMRGLHGRCESLGRKAGPIRTRACSLKAKWISSFAFPGGRGTAAMVRLARETGIEVIEIHDGADAAQHGAAPFDHDLSADSS